MSLYTVKIPNNRVVEMITNKKKIELRKFKSYYLQGVSDKELASMFNLTIGSVRNKTHKIRKENDRSTKI